MADPLLASVVCTIAHAAEHFSWAARTWRRQSEHYTLLVCAGSQVAAVVGEQTAPLGEGVVLLVPRGVPFGPADEGEGRGRRARVIEVQFEARLHGLLDMPALYGLPLVHHLTKNSMEKVAQAARRIVYDVGRARPGFEMAVNSHCLFILSFLWRDIAERGEAAARGAESGEVRAVRAADVARLAPVLRTIEENCAAPLTLKQLADLVHLNPAYFATWFRQVTGLAPHEYLARYRLQRAQAMLLATDQTLEQIAGATGHANRSHLTRAFRRVMGVTPSQLRARTSSK